MTQPFYGPLWPVEEFGEVATPMLGAGGVGYQSYASFEGAASATVTITGTTGAGPTVTITLNGHGVLYTYVSGDTTTTIAAGHIVTALQADGTDNGLFTLSSSANVITITAKNPGAVGMVSLATTVAGGAVATVSASALDLANNVVVPTSSYGVNTLNGPQSFYKDAPELVTSPLKTQLRSSGLVK